MILQRCFLKLKSAAVADSWFMHTSVMQYLIKTGLYFFNRIAPKTPLCQRVRAGSLGKNNDIHPTAIIDYDRVIIGDFCTIGENAVIEKNTIIGSHVTIGPGVVIGSEGFEVRRFKDEIIPVAHLGGVIIHDNVSVGPRTCIDKSSLGEYTEIGESTRLLGGVEVGHGIKIGKNVTVSEGTMIGGYSKIGDRVIIGRRCSITDGLTLEDDVVLPDNTVVTRDVKRTPQETGRL
ncbi:DapH/DapD/GlmU-related protein [uncultured Methanoregula sp.]|uniref:DapH/DapD/GlmU-related protein n=1 Tax=uncultured Methanoregula sp. TaxID=1005933 RepID=UPI002AAC387C|nr:DapH/DapD/GlmU-related protein [uncultured Methanoregula sp.]